MRRVPPKPTPRVDHRGEPGWRDWHQPIWGNCAVCSQPGRLERHHVVLEQHVRAAGGDPWDTRNALELGRYCRCHRDHHQAARRISLKHVPDQAVAFASELLGEGAGAYLSRYYSP